MRPDIVEQYPEFEYQCYNDPRGDTGPEWGVWETQCGACGRRLNIVAKIDCPFWRLCSRCLEQAS
jgi:hypothetical protein